MFWFLKFKLIGPAQVTMRNQAPSQTLQVPGEKVKKKEKKPKKGKKGKKVFTKADISGPQNFKHIGKIWIEIM